MLLNLKQFRWHFFGTLSSTFFGVFITHLFIKRPGVAKEQCNVGSASFPIPGPEAKTRMLPEFTHVLLGQWGDSVVGSVFTSGSFQYRPVVCSTLHTAHGTLHTAHGTLNTAVDTMLSHSALLC